MNETFRQAAARFADLVPDGRREAALLSRALIDVDGMLTDEELSAWIDSFGDLSSAQHASPAELRKAGFFRKARRWLLDPSPAFRALVTADRHLDTRRGLAYVKAGVELGLALAALDDHTSHVELAAIDTWRERLLKELRIAGVEHPLPGGDGDSPEDPPDNRTLEDLMAELDELIGLDDVKSEVRRLTDLLRIQRLRQERGLPVHGHSHHLVFTGNPGTGKTTVARLLAAIYRVIGVVSKGHLVETDRAGLVAGYVGQTAARVDEVVSSALGGVLLVDEAYSLAREDDFGREAIDALVKRMEDHRDDLVVIVAGYPVEMEHLLDANPGLRSRFPRTIHFGDMTDDQLVDVFAAFCRRSRYEAGPDVLGAVADHLAALPRGRDFGNARTVRNLFEATLEGQAGRLVRDRAIDEASLVHLAASDVPPPPGPGRDRPAAPQGAAGRSST